MKTIKEILITIIIIQILIEIVCKFGNVNLFLFENLFYVFLTFTSCIFMVLKKNRKPFFDEIDEKEKNENYYTGLIGITLASTLLGVILPKITQLLLYYIKSINNNDIKTIIFTLAVIFFMRLYINKDKYFIKKKGE